MTRYRHTHTERAAVMWTVVGQIIRISGLFTTRIDTSSCSCSSFSLQVTKVPSHSLENTNCILYI